MGSSNSHHVVPVFYGSGADKKMVKDSPVPPMTDLWRWSLVVEEGRQRWIYLDDERLSAGEVHECPIASRYHVGLPIDPESLRHPVCPCQTCRDTAEEMRREREGHDGDGNCVADVAHVENAVRKAMDFFGQIQTPDGHWAGDYGGPMFLLPGLVIVCHATGFQLTKEQSAEIIRYLFNLQNSDGGYGIHIECGSTIFGSILSYVTLRLLGVSKDHPVCDAALRWIRKNGGAIGIPQWGKFWLAILGVYSWDGLTTLLPEMALLPFSFPLHPSQMWCYCRTVYCSMSYLYGIRFQCPVDDLIREFRSDLFCNENGENVNWDAIDWKKARLTVNPADLYTPHTWLLDFSFSILQIYEDYLPKFGVRQKALDYLYLVSVTKEDEFSHYIDIGPVNKALNMLCVWTREGPQSLAYKKHCERVADYLWMGRDGMKMNGTNGSQLWDTSFLVQGLIENERLRSEYGVIFDRANNFVDLTQIRVNHPDHNMYWRDQTRGGWPFSTRDIGWVVADCTGEGLKAAILCRVHSLTSSPLSPDRLQDAVDLLLVMQNPTGGWATCEKTRGGKYFEYFNASEVFGEIMIDYDYVECTSSALQALAIFSSYDPLYRKDDVTKSIEMAKNFILSIQREDGSWEGMWGICFTYGIWFALDGLLSAGVPPDHPAIVKAVDFLISKQKEDGGWGETFMSCVEQKYVQNETSQVVNTAWAVLAIMKTKNPKYLPSIKKGIQVLMQRQLPDGDWPQENICGVFNKNCMISYSNFKNIFPIWALCRYAATFSSS